MKLVLFILVFLLPIFAFAQDSMLQASVIVHEDPRIELLTQKPVIKRFTGKTNGFRIQIYNGNDRNEANKIKMSFLRNFPETRAYLTYHNPQFRVRIGDFRTRREAIEFSRLISRKYIIMIVPEIIYVAPPKN